MAATALILCGCSSDYYRRDADRDINALLRERKQQVLAYQPNASPDKGQQPIPAPMGKGIYEKIPVSPVSDNAKQAMKLRKIEIPAVPLGPTNRFPTYNPDQETSYESSARSRTGVSVVMGPFGVQPAQNRMDLFGVLRYATNHSRDYQTQMEQLYFAALDVSLERHLFTPRPFANQTAAFDGGQRDVAYRSALTATTDAGVRQKLPYGGEIVANSLVSFVDALNKNTEGGESASVALTGTIPLLRGAGMINLEGLINSERQVVYAVRAFESYRRSFLVDIASRYYALLVSRSGVINRRQNLDNLIDLTESSRALFAAGKTSYLDVQRSLNSQISGEVQLVSAEELYRSAIDNLKLVIGMDPSEELEVVPVQIDLDQPQVNDAMASRLAVEYRLDVRTARDQVDDAQRAANNAKNGLLPDLSILARGAIGSGTDPVTGAANNTTGLYGDSTTYSAGATLGLPLDRLAERNIYRRSLILQQQSLRNFQQKRDAAQTDARTALRRIRAATDRVELARRNVAVSQARLDLSNELLRQPLLNPLPGLTGSNRDVVDAQSALLSARDDLDSALASQAIQVLSYYRDTGTLRLDPAAGVLARALERRDGDGDTDPKMESPLLDPTTQPMP